MHTAKSDTINRERTLCKHWMNIKRSMSDSDITVAGQHCKNTAIVKIKRHKTKDT